MGIQAGGFATVFADFDTGIVLGFGMILSQFFLVVVATIRTDIFSAHGIGEKAGTTIIVARRLSTILIVKTVLSSIKRRMHRRFATNRLFVRKTGPAKGHVIAFLAFESGKGFIVVGFGVGGIKYFASMTPRCRILFGIAFGTASFSFVQWIMLWLRFGVIFVLARDKGFEIFEFGSVL